MLGKLMEIVEWTDTSKAYRDTYLRTPKSRYTGIPVISRTPNTYTLIIFICLDLWYIKYFQAWLDPKRVLYCCIPRWDILIQSKFLFVWTYDILYIFRHGWTPKGSYIAVSPGGCSSYLRYSGTLIKAGNVNFKYKLPDASIIFHVTVSMRFLVSFSQKNLWGSTVVECLSQAAWLETEGLPV